jgi:hypothetical protein
MTLRNYYVVPRDAVDYSFFQDTQHFDLDGGLTLLSATFNSDEAQSTWEAQPNVISLPHLFDKTPVDDSTVALLSQIGAVSGNTTADIKKLARAVFPLM